MYIVAGALVSRFAIFVALDCDDVEAFWLTIDGMGDEPID